MSRREEETDDLWRNVLTDAAVNNWCLNEENADDPRKMLDAIIKANVAQALDPAISEDAQRLRREGFEMARDKAAAYIRNNAMCGADDLAAHIRAMQMDGPK